MGKARDRFKKIGDTKGTFLTLEYAGGSDGKVSAYNAGDQGLISGLGRFPWRRKWEHTPVLFPGKSHGWRNLVGYSPWGCKESEMTHRLHFYFKGIFHAKMGTIKDRNSMNLTEAEDIKKKEVARIHRRAIQKRSLLSR